MTSRMIAGFLVELAATLDAEALGHRDLHVLDVVPVPDRLEERVRKPEVEDVLNRFLPEIVIDAEDRLLGKCSCRTAVELLCRCEVAAERLLDDDPARWWRIRRSELADNEREHARWDGEIMRRPAAALELRFAVSRTCPASP